MFQAKLLIRTYFRRKIGALSDLVEPLFVDIVECEENESVTIVVAGLYNNSQVNTHPFQVLCGENGTTNY